MQKNDIGVKIKKKVMEKIAPNYLDLIVGIISKQYNTNKKTVRKDIKDKYYQYGISYKEYFDRNLFGLSKDKFYKMINEEKKMFAESISTIKNESVEMSLTKMEKICQDCKIPYRRYYKYKYYNLHEVSVLNLAVIYSEAYKNERLKIAVKLLKKSKHKVKARMKFVKEKYGITNNEFLSHDYCFFSNAEIKKEKEKIDYPYLISQQSKLSYEEAKLKADDVLRKFKVSKKTYKSRLYYQMSDEEILNDIEERRNELLEAIVNGAQEAGLSLREFIYNSKIDNLKYGTTLSDYILFKMYDKTEKERITWINYDKDVRNLKRKYRIKENDILENKIKFNSNFPDEIGRKWWTNNNENTYDAFLKFISGLEEIIIKPVAGKEGKGIQKVQLKNYKSEDLYNYLLSKELLIAEECIVQHESLSEFYPDCVHCCRIVAILDKDKCYFPQTSIKFGVNAVSDNLATGSICANIDLETGIVCTDGATKKGDIAYTHPYSGKRFRGYKIPYWKEALALSEAVIRKIPDINMIGFDIAITPKGPIIVEGNDTPDFRVYDYPLIGQKNGMRYKLKPFITEYKCNW